MDGLEIISSRTGDSRTNNIQHKYNDFLILIYFQTTAFLCLLNKGKVQYHSFSQLAGSVQQQVRQVQYYLTQSFCQPKKLILSSHFPISLDVTRYLHIKVTMKEFIKKTWHIQEHTVCDFSSSEVFMFLQQSEDLKVPVRKLSLKDSLKGEVWPLQNPRKVQINLITEHRKL